MRCEFSRGNKRLVENYADCSSPVVTVQEPTPGSSGASTNSGSSSDKGLWMKSSACRDGEGGKEEKTIDEQVEGASG